MKKITSIAILLSLAVAAVAQEAPHKYEIKSGIVTTVTEVMGQKSEVVSYFDDYGAMEAAKSKVTVPGQGELEIASITKDGKMYMVNYTAKQVQEMPLPESINYLAITDEQKAQYKIEEAGTEMLGDKECKKYTEEISQMGQTANVTVWVWKGYALKTVTSISGMQIVAEVTEFEEDAFILPQTFEIPQF